MNAQGIHLIAFDVPYPADYGGVVDIYFKLKSLSELGLKIHLHLFQYNRPKSEHLNQFCQEIYYYKRAGVASMLSIRPYIVASRNDWQLLKNLQKNDWPIIFEGLHTTFFLNHRVLAKRNKIVRMHNVEHHYYAQLSKVESNGFKKIYFKIEAIKLKWYENVLSLAQHILAISDKDFQYFHKRFQNAKVSYLSPFIQSDAVNINTGLGDYILYHGNLSVPENENAVSHLLNHILPFINKPLVIAGKNPSKALEEKIKILSNVRLIANPSDDELKVLIGKAQINIFYTHQATGVKLKLFNALLNGRHCLVNSTMLAGTHLHSLCNIANTDDAMISEINKLFSKPFSENDIGIRKEFFLNNFNNKNNATALAELCSL